MIGFLFWYLVLSFCSYSNARIGLFEVTIDDEEQLQKLEELSTQLECDLWRPIELGKAIQFTAEIDVDNVRFIRSQLLGSNLTVKVINENLDHIINRTINDESKDNSVQKVKKFQSKKGIETYFASHKEYNEWLEILAQQYPDIVSLKNIGKSYKGRDMKVIKISTGTNKEAIFLDGGIHAREWLAVSSVVYILNKMIAGHNSRDASVKEVLNKFDVYFLPVTNPDGYETSRLGGRNRMWRKNTMPVGYRCKGVDLNRNFDIDLGKSGVSRHPCSDIYPGDKPFSAPETQNFRDFVLSIKDKLKLFVSFHAFSQLLLTPWGYTKSPPPDNAELMRVANIMVDSIYKVNGARYQVGSPAHFFNPTSGSSMDWVKQQGVKYSYAFEVRPERGGPGGFIAPIELIKPVGEELYAGVMGAAKSIN